MMKLTQAIVKELLDYKPRTGTLTWCTRELKRFKSAASYQRWNKRYAGKLAFTYESHGHKVGIILYQPHTAQRIIWLWMTGKWPKAIAYRNGNGTDNRWSNLVERKNAADVRDYQRYKRGQLSGKPWRTPSGSYVARLGRMYLGCFASRADAIACRDKAAAERWGN